MENLDDNKQLVRAMIAAVNARDLAALDAIISPSVQRHCEATPGVVVENIDQFKTFLEGDFATIPDSVVTIQQLLAEGDLVSVWATYEGTQEGPFGPFPASGRRMRIDFGSHVRIEAGLIAEMWVTWDNLNALVQLGHIDPAKP